MSFLYKNGISLCMFSKSNPLFFVSPFHDLPKLQCIKVHNRSLYEAKKEPSKSAVTLSEILLMPIQRIYSVTEIYSEVLHILDHFQHIQLIMCASGMLCSAGFRAMWAVWPHWVPSWRWAPVATTNAGEHPVTWSCCPKWSLGEKSIVAAQSHAR